ncbi:MAG TPA: alanine racemase, partial [Candidatus Limnocylindrales bacterium]|nr:alanine racemase [Candidatus Limnocylindrales bacterium]
TFSCLAAEHGVILPLHIEVDTGMGRLGLLVEDAVEIIARIHSLAGLEIEGIFTHFAAADEKESSYTATQLHRFGTVLDDCRERGISFPIVHAANSAAAIAYPETRFDLVRLGISLYGCYPSPWFKSDTLRLLPALSLKSKVVAVKKVPPETPISYGYTFHTAKESLIATVTSGYADGYSRLFSNSGQVLVRGQRAPVVGRVCMDYFMIDVSHIPGVCLGDEVVLYGYQGEEQISVEEAAEIIGTFNYEVLCSVSKKVPRYYFREGRLTDARSL